MILGLAVGIVPVAALATIRIEKVLARRQQQNTDGSPGTRRWNPGWRRWPFRLSLALFLAAFIDALFARDGWHGTGALPGFQGAVTGLLCAELGLLLATMICAFAVGVERRVRRRIRSH